MTCFPPCTCRSCAAQAYEKYDDLLYALTPEHAHG